jgi:hypothetical protein
MDLRRLMPVDSAFRVAPVAFNGGHPHHIDDAKSVVLTINHHRPALRAESDIVGMSNLHHFPIRQPHAKWMEWFRTNGFPDGIEWQAEFLPLAHPASSRYLGAIALSVR